MSVFGYCDPKFIKLKEYFENSIDSRFELGAAISIEIQGERVVNLWGGFKDANRLTPWEEDTLCNTFSVSKAMASACILKLIEEKKINQLKNKIVEDNINQTGKDIIDVCSILEKCSIDEISKYLLIQGKKKSFPDITTR